MNKIDKINFKGERAVIRVDYNVPIDENNKITDLTRIKSSKQTIQMVIKNGGSVVLLTHIGRPKGVDRRLSCSLILNSVSKVMGQNVIFCDETVGDLAEKSAANLKPGQIILMEKLVVIKVEVYLYGLKE